MEEFENEPRSHKPHPLHWVVEPLMEGRSYLEKAMFGCRGCYLNGRLVVVLASRRPPWKGLLVPTDRSHHASLRDDIPELHPHPVLGKWLYLPDDAETFEEVASGLVERIMAGDERLGVTPQPRKPRR